MSIVLACSPRNTQIFDLSTLSDGSVIENPKHLRTAQRKLARLQRVVSRRQKGSGRRKDAVKRIAKLHERISNKRKDAIHKFL
jgi:putative transposase